PEDGTALEDFWRPTALPDLIREGCERHGIDFIDLTPVLTEAARDRGELVYNPIVDTHLNARGAELVAGELARRLRATGPGVSAGAEPAPEPPRAGRAGRGPGTARPARRRAGSPPVWFRRGADRRLPRGAVALEESLNLLEEPGGAGWLREEQRGPAILGFLPGHEMTARADHDDRDRCGGGTERERGECAASVEVRHEHIHDDEIRVGGAGELERLPAIAGLEKFEAALLEAEFLDAEHVGLVIHDQDFRGEFIHGSGAGSGRERSSPSRSRVRSSCA